MSKTTKTVNIDVSSYDDRLIEQPAEQPAEQAIEQHAEKATEQPAGQAVDGSDDGVSIVRNVTTKSFGKIKKTVKNFTCVRRRNRRLCATWCFIWERGHPPRYPKSRSRIGADGILQNFAGLPRW